MDSSLQPEFCTSYVTPCIIYLMGASAVLVYALWTPVKCTRRRIFFILSHKVNGYAFNLTSQSQRPCFSLLQAPMAPQGPFKWKGTTTTHHEQESAWHWLRMTLQVFINEPTAGHMAM